MHPKSFNSPVFVIRKRNSKDRKIAEFKSTLNKVFIDIDPYLEQIIDSISLKLEKATNIPSNLTPTMIISKSS